MGQIYETKITIPLTKEQKDILQNAVDQIPGATLAAWCRSVLLKESEKR